MNNQAKTNAELLAEIVALKKKINKLEKTETAAKQGDAKRRESEETYRTILENIEDGYFETNLSGLYTYVNDTICKYVQYSREELLIKGFNLFQDKVNAQKTYEAFHNIYKTGEPIKSIEMQYIRRDGAIGTSEISASLIRDAQGKPVGFRGTSRDITDRKRAQEALRTSEELYSKLVDTLPDVIIRTDLEGKILFVNDYAFQINGYRRDEIEGQNILQYIALEDQSTAVQNLALMMEGKVIPHEYQLLTKDGRKIPFEMNGNVLRNENGIPFGVVVVGRNISERKQTEDIIKRSEEQYRRIAENMSDLVCEVDAQSIFKYVSPSHLRILGYAAEDLLRRPVYEYVHPEDLEKIVAEGGQGVRSGEEREVEYRYRHKNGHYVWLRSIGHSLRNTEGDHAGAVISSSDITERKHADEERQKLLDQLIQAQKMESVGRLAGGVAHDFNNMLSVIIGNTEMAIRKINHSDPVHSSLQEVLNAGKRSADLTRQLLAFARKQTVSPKVLDLNDTVAGMFKMLQRLIGEDIDLNWRPGHNLWSAKIDPSQVDQILANLMVNARDAIEKTGRITIETTNTACDETYCQDRPEWIPGDYVVLAVSDSGCGMKKETMVNIFEPFFTTKKEGEGTGLGLATVYGIVKQNNGFINVYSEPGQGTTFRIYLPRYLDESMETVDDEEEPEIQGGTETVLVVEDSETVLKLCKAMLETLGYKVLRARGKDQALELARKHSGNIDLLLTDVVMPDINGKELSERIIAIIPGLKRLYMSGYTADVIARQGILDEGIQFIPKPFSIKDLAAKVREVLG